MTDSTNVMHVEAAIIGTGQAAPSLAVAFAGMGERVALFEGGMVGGSCVNVGCTPTKALRASARVAHLARRALEYGIRVGDVDVDFAAVMRRSTGVVTASRGSLESWLLGTAGITLVREWARVDGMSDGRFVVRAGPTTVHARRLYLNTGTRPLLPDIPGLADVGALTNETVMALTERPRHLVILGGSYIGLELGQAFRRLGSEVTIIEPSPTVASREDPDISERIAEMLRNEGISLALSSKVERVERVEGSEASPGSGSELRMHVRDASADADYVVTGTHLLVATGRVPNTQSLGLASIGVSVDARGYVPVNGRLETNVPGVWAVGDINRRGAFTHTSYQDHEIVLANARGGDRSVDGRTPTYAMYTDPPLGRVGLTVTEARAQMAAGRRFLVAQHEMRDVSRAKEEGETTGVMRLLVDADTRRFAGATLLGIRADEIVQVISSLMAAGATYEVLRDALPIHPTVAEFFPTILGRLAPLT